MATYNEKNVIEFLVSLSFESHTVFIYARRGLVAKQFGCTEKTAAKWIDRAESTGLIKPTKYGFVMADQKAERAKQNRIEAVQAGVDSGKVIRLASVRCERVQKAYAAELSTGVVL